MIKIIKVFITSIFLFSFDPILMTPDKERSTITFVANAESMGDGLHGETMDYFQGVQYPHLALAVPHLQNENYKVEVVDWQNPKIQWKEKGKIILGPVWGYTKTIEKFISWLDFVEKNQIDMINSPKFLKWNIDKHYLNDLKSNNILIPKTMIIDSDSKISFEQAASEFEMIYGSADIIMKGVIDAGAFGYLHVTSENRDEAGERFETLKSQNHGVILQAFLPEISQKGELAFVFFDDEISHYFLKVPPYNEEKVQPFYGGKSFHFKKESDVGEQIQFIQRDFRTDLRITEGEVKSGYEQAKQVYVEVLKILDQLNIPHPKYLRVDGVMVDSQFVIMELEGVEPYLEMQEAMKNDPSNPILKKYVEGVVGLAP